VVYKKDGVCADAEIRRFLRILLMLCEKALLSCLLWLGKYGGGGVYINRTTVLKTDVFLLFCPFWILLFNRIVCNLLQMLGVGKGVFGFFVQIFAQLLPNFMYIKVRLCRRCQ
jgi:hypothetical protein